MSVLETLPSARLQVRDATLDDIPAITAIYEWHVLHGRGSFEESPPTISEMAERLNAVHQQQLPGSLPCTVELWWVIAMQRRIARVRRIVIHSKIQFISTPA